MTSAPPSTSDAVKVVFILFFAGLAILIALIFLTYGISWLVDWLLSTTAIRSLHNDDVRVIDGGVVARDAGLLGLTREERREVLAMLLPSKSFRVNSKEQQIVMTDEEEKNCGNLKSRKKSVGSSLKSLQHAVERCDCIMKKRKERESSAACVVMDDVSNETSSGENEVGTSVTAEGQSENDGEVEDLESGVDELTCAICLSKYEEGEAVITGRYCSHMFHAACLLEWLDKHDICPCCRVGMMTPDEMRDATIKVYGRKKSMKIFMRDPWRTQSGQGINNREVSRGTTENSPVNDSDHTTAISLVSSSHTVTTTTSRMIDGSSIAFTTT